MYNIMINSIVIYTYLGCFLRWHTCTSCIWVFSHVCAELMMKLVRGCMKPYLHSFLTPILLPWQSLVKSVLGMGLPESLRGFSAENSTSNCFSTVRHFCFRTISRIATAGNYGLSVTHCPMSLSGFLPVYIKIHSIGVSIPTMYGPLCYCVDRVWVYHVWRWWALEH